MVDKVKDPVSGMEIRPEGRGRDRKNEGRTFYFCSRACHLAFVNDAQRSGHRAAEHRDH